MSDLDFTGLGDLAAKGAKAPAGWEPLTIDDLADGGVLAFDQSLTATGMVVVTKMFGVVRVVMAEKWSPYSGDRGMEIGFRRGQSIYAKAKIRMYQALHEGWDVVHETPPTAGKVPGSGLSSSQAAQALWCAADEIGCEITMLGSQPGKKLVCGNSNAPKPEAHAGLKLHCFPWIESVDFVTNEAQRDALIVALLHLHRKNR